MSRRTPGEGTISQRKDGRWQAALQLGGKRATIYGKTKTEAVEKLRALASQARTARHLPDAGKITVAAYLDEWLQQARGRLRPKSHLDYSIMVRNHITPALGTARLTRLQPLQLARFYAALGEGVSPRRVRMVHDFLHKSLGDAARWGLLATSPAAFVDAPKREGREPALWSPEQVTVFLQAVHGSQGGQYRNTLAFLLASGCRVGEAAGLRWQDLDWERRTVRIERQITEMAGKPLELPPKTRSGVRTITLPTWGMEALHRQKAQVAGWRLRAGEGWRGAERVFTSQTGAVPSFSNLRRAFEGLAHKLGLPRLRVHHLRHLKLSMLAMNGVPVRVAQQRAGHSNLQMTARVYQHVLGDADRQAAQALEQAPGWKEDPVNSDPGLPTAPWGGDQ